MNITSGAQDFRPLVAGTGSDVVNVNMEYTGSGYANPTATTRIALLLCKTSLTTQQREAITDYLDAL